MVRRSARAFGPERWRLTAAPLFPADRIANPGGTFKVRYGDELITPSEHLHRPGGSTWLWFASYRRSHRGRRTGFVSGSA